MGLAILSAILAPATASAHLVSSGAGPFYDGVAHFFLSPEDLILAFSLALFGGLRGRRAAKALVLALPSAWFGGCAAGLYFSSPSPPDALLFAGIILAGLLAAINPKLPAAFPALLAVILGICHGFANGRAMAATHTPLLAGAGIVAALALWVLWTAALTVTRRKPWQRIAARVLGSWAAAIGLLAIAWQLRPGS